MSKMAIMSTMFIMKATTDALMSGSLVTGKFITVVIF